MQLINLVKKFFAGLQALENTIEKDTQDSIKLDISAIFVQRKIFDLSNAVTNSLKRELDIEDFDVTRG